MALLSFIQPCIDRYDEVRHSFQSLSSGDMSCEDFKDFEEDAQSLLDPPVFKEEAVSTKVPAIKTPSSLPPSEDDTKSETELNLNIGSGLIEVGKANHRFSIDQTVDLDSETEYYSADSSDSDYSDVVEDEVDVDRIDGLSSRPVICSPKKPGRLYADQFYASIEDSSDATFDTSSDAEIPDMLGKKKRMSVSTDELSSVESVSRVPATEPDPLNTRLSVSHPNLYPPAADKNRRSGGCHNPPPKKRSMRNPLKKLRGIFKSASKLSESTVYEEAGFKAKYNHNPIYLARQPKSDYQF